MTGIIYHDVEWHLFINILNHSMLTISNSRSKAYIANLDSFLLASSNLALSTSNLLLIVFMFKAVCHLHDFLRISVRLENTMV